VVRRLGRIWRFACLAVAAILAIGAPYAGSAAEKKQQTTTETTINRPPPSTEPEIRRLRIKWFVERTFDAYSQGVADKRPIVIFFHAIPCGFCQRQLDRFRCPFLARHAGFLEFGYTTYAGSGGYKDEGGRHLGEVFGVKKFPTMVVLMPDLDRLQLIGRVQGEFSAEQVDGLLRKAYDSEAYRKAIGAPPNLLSASETALMLDQLGIKRPDPAFCANKDR
jgi:hypothetical protein